MQGWIYRSGKVWRSPDLTACEAASSSSRTATDGRRKRVSLSRRRRKQKFFGMRTDGPTWLGLMGHVSAEQVYKPGLAELRKLKSRRRRKQKFFGMRTDGPTWLGLMGHVSAEQVYKPGLAELRKLNSSVPFPFADSVSSSHVSFVRTTKVTIDGKCDSTRVRKKGRAKEKISEIGFSYFEFVS
jgi:hypothetical protein